MFFMLLLALEKCAGLFISSRKINIVERCIFQGNSVQKARRQELSTVVRKGFSLGLMTESIYIQIPLMDLLEHRFHKIF